MNISGWCIKNNRTFLLLIFSLIFIGVSTYINMSRLEDPKYIVRSALVSTYFPGAAPQKVEELVTDKIEKAIRQIPEIDYLESHSMNGTSFILVNIQEKYKKMTPIWNRLRNKIKNIKQELPQGVIGPFVNDEYGDVFGIVVALTGDGYSYKELKDIAKKVRNNLKQVKDTAKVKVLGKQDERIFINFASAKMAKLGISPATIIDSLKKQNALQSSGNALTGPERIVIESTGEFKSINQIKNTTISIPGKAQNIQLKDIANVVKGYLDPPLSLTRFNGQPCLYLAISMAKGGNILEQGEAIQTVLEKIETKLPVGISFEYLALQPKFVDRAIGDFMGNLYEAFAFVFIVMLLFTGIRTALVAGLLVPMAIILCFTIMPFFDIVLQRVSIASLIIALGMLVDNGIVVSEMILVKLANGVKRLEAVTSSIKELWITLLSSSLTTIFAFLPIITAKSAVGEYCSSLFIVITITLLSSWLLSLTFIPFLCYYVLKPKLSKQDFKGKFYQLYRSFLIFVLKRRVAFVVTLVLLTCISWYLFRYVPKIFFPPNDREIFMVDFWQPYGTDIMTNANRTAKLEKFLLSQKGVDSIGSFVGSAGPRWYLSLSMEMDKPNYSLIIINTKTMKDIEPLIAKTKQYIADNFPDSRGDIKRLESGPSVGAPVQVRITGNNLDKLIAIRNQVYEIIGNTPGVQDVWDNWGEWTKKMVVDINQEKAKRAGISSEDIAYSLNTQVSGMEITQFRKGDTIIPIVLRAKESERKGMGKLEDLHVYSFSNNKSVPLSQVAKTRLTWQPSDINRRTQQRTITVKAAISGRFASEIMADIVPQLKKMETSPDWPFGYSISIGGENEQSAKASNSIMAGLPFAIALILLCLISQFNSVRRTLIILITIPPMFVGITIGMFVTKSAFGFMAMLGMISLMGIIVNNAIILIASIEEERNQGRSPIDAVIIAAQKRFRPIIMTACTTIVGMIPLSVSGGEMWSPMANVIIFGLAFATVLTLGLCPVLYSLFFKLRYDKYVYDPNILTEKSN